MDIGYKISEFLDKDWMWIFKKFIRYGSGVKKSISAHLCLWSEYLWRLEGTL